MPVWPAITCKPGLTALHPAQDQSHFHLAVIRPWDKPVTTEPAEAEEARLAEAAKAAAAEEARLAEAVKAEVPKEVKDRLRLSLDDLFRDQ